jgi:hypothetical protein
MAYLGKISSPCDLFFLSKQFVKISLAEGSAFKKNIGHPLNFIKYTP